MGAPLLHRRRGKRAILLVALGKERGECTASSLRSFQSLESRLRRGRIEKKQQKQSVEEGHGGETLPYLRTKRAKSEKKNCCPSCGRLGRFTIPLRVTRGKEKERKGKGRRSMMRKLHVEVGVVITLLRRGNQRRASLHCEDNAPGLPSFFA